MAKAKDRPSTPRAAKATGESADASAHREKTSLSSQRSAKKCVSSATSTVTSPHRLPVATAGRKGAPCPKPLASAPEPPVVRKTCRPALTAAAQQAQPLHKVFDSDHRCLRRGHVRESAAAKRSGTSHSRQPHTHECPANTGLHDEHTGRLAHLGGSPDKGRLPDAVKKQMERPQAGRARRGKIRHGGQPVLWLGADAEKMCMPAGGGATEAPP